MGFWDDTGDTFMGAGSGAATGAMLGSVVPGVGTGIGAGAGALLGGLTGLFSGHGARSAADTQRAALDDAMKRLQQFSIQQQQKRQQDLSKTMAFYGPAEAYLKSIYSRPPEPSMRPPDPTAGPTRGRLPPLTG